MLFMAAIGYIVLVGWIFAASVSWVRRFKHIEKEKKRRRACYKIYRYIDISVMSNNNNNNNYMFHRESSFIIDDFRNILLLLSFLFIMYQF
jgi:hypothetical protein